MSSKLAKVFAILLSACAVSAQTISPAPKSPVAERPKLIDLTTGTGKPLGFVYPKLIGASRRPRMIDAILKKGCPLRIPEAVFTIIPDGSVTNAFVVVSSGDEEIDSGIFQDVSDWHYMPPAFNGKPVSLRVKLSIKVAIGNCKPQGPEPAPQPLKSPS